MIVVVGVDGSPYSMKAVEWVANSPAAVERVVVVSAAHAGMAMSDSRLVQLVREAAEGHVREATQALTALSKVTGRVVDGEPRTVLVDAARAEDADLLVVGSRGRTGVARLLLGSVAAHVAEHAPCNTLIVRSKNAV
jgi:nucleotide-binding universal stress UspA family protein